MTNEEFGRKMDKAISTIENEITELKSLLDIVRSHSLANCQNNHHLIMGYATGGDSGEYVTVCRLCDYRTYGYD